MNGVDNMHLHVLDEHQRRADDPARQLRRRHRPQHRPGAVPDALLAGRVAAARRTCATSASRSRSPPTSPLVLFSLYSPERAPTTPSSSANYAYININDPMTRVPGHRAGARSSAPASTRCASGCGPTCWPSSSITVPEIVSAIQRAEHREPGRPDRRRAGPAGPGVHLHRARPGPPASAGGVRRHRRAREPRRLGGPHAGRGARRARRAELQRRRAASTASPPRSSPSTRLPGSNAIDDGARRPRR